MSLLPNLDEMTDEQKMAVLQSIQKSIAESKEVQKQKIAANVDLVVQALKKIESDIRSRFDDVGNAIEKRVSSIKDGRDGINGKDGRDGKDGKNGRDGAKGDKGDAGRDGRDGVDGVDGVSVTSARIDFDGSLIISLSTGVELNVGEVVASDLAERIKVITNGGGTSQSVLDTLASLQTQIDDLIPSQTGNSGKFLTTDGTDLSWASVAGGLSYQGTWNASTNTPTLASGTGTNGYYYVVATAGSTNLDGITDWAIGDWLLFNGSAWQKIDQSNLVTSVNGQTGAVSLTTTNISEGTNIYYTDARARASISAGTGISYDSSTGVVTNSAPDQTVSLTGAGTTSISGTYPNFTITSADSTVGTVTSVGGTGTVSGISLSGTVTSSGNLTLGGSLDLSSPPTIGNTTPNTGTFTTLTVNDNTTLGSSNTDTVTFTARVSSEFSPSADNTYDLGRTGHEWRDLYIDGTANIDSLIADTADINAGTIDGTTIGASSASTGAFTTLSATGVTTVQAGTAAAPAITTTGDTNTGFFFPAADTIGASEGGVSIGNMNTWYRGLFRKTDPTIVAWTKTGAGTATTSSILYIEVNGALKTIASGTSISMPTLASGTDYAIWAKTDGTLQATTDHTSPPTANARKVGGFHYAHGGNATGTSGGDTTPAINEYSMWDLKWRPTAPDPRGMTLVGGGYWSDIYLTGVDAITNGSSKYNVTMADGSSPPKVPTMFGGNGSTTYGTYTWFEAMELATAFGKRCPTQAEFMSLAYGTTEASSIGSDQGSTILNAAYTSKWGVMQAAGVLWVWGRDRGGAYATGGWNANTEGRGSEYNAPNSALFGGLWATSADAGSRCSDWSGSASNSSSNIGSRFVCDHLQLD